MLQLTKNHLELYNQQIVKITMYFMIAEMGFVVGRRISVVLEVLAIERP